VMYAFLFIIYIPETLDFDVFEAISQKQKEVPWNPTFYGDVVDCLYNALREDLRAREDALDMSLHNCATKPNDIFLEKCRSTYSIAYFLDKHVQQKLNMEIEKQSHHIRGPHILSRSEEEVEEEEDAVEAKKVTSRLQLMSSFVKSLAFREYMGKNEILGINLQPQMEPLLWGAIRYVSMLWMNFRDDFIFSKDFFGVKNSKERRIVGRKVSLFGFSNLPKVLITKLVFLISIMSWVLAYELDDARMSPCGGGSRCLIVEPFLTLVNVKAQTLFDVMILISLMFLVSDIVIKVMTSLLYYVFSVCDSGPSGEYYRDIMLGYYDPNGSRSLMWSFFFVVVLYEIKIHDVISGTLLSAMIPNLGGTPCWDTFSYGQSQPELIERVLCIIWLGSEDPVFDFQEELVREFVGVFLILCVILILVLLLNEYTDIKRISLRLKGRKLDFKGVFMAVILPLLSGILLVLIMGFASTDMVLGPRLPTVEELGVPITPTNKSSSCSSTAYAFTCRNFGDSNCTNWLHPAGGGEAMCINKRTRDSYSYWVEAGFDSYLFYLESTCAILFLVAVCILTCFKFELFRKSVKQSSRMTRFLGKTKKQAGFFSFFFLPMCHHFNIHGSFIFSLLGLFALGALSIFEIIGIFKPSLPVPLMIILIANELPFMLRYLSFVLRWLASRRHTLKFGQSCMDYHHIESGDTIGLMHSVSVKSIRAMWVVAATLFCILQYVIVLEDYCMYFEAAGNARANNPNNEKIKLP